MSRPSGVMLPHWVSFRRDDRRLPRFPSGAPGYFYGAPDSRWVDGDGKDLGDSCEFARVTTAVSLVDRPCVSLMAPSTPVWSWSRATSDGNVDGRVQAWTRLAVGHDHRNICERIGRVQPTTMGGGKSQRDSPFFVAPLFGRYSSSPGCSSVFKAYAGVRGAYAGRTQAYGERTQYAVSTRTISSRVVSLRVLSRFSQLSRSRLRCSLSLTATSAKSSGRLLAVWSLLGCFEQGVLFPEGSQVMVMRVAEGLLSPKGAVNSTQPKKPQRGGPVAQDQTSSQLKNRKASRL